MLKPQDNSRAGTRKLKRQWDPLLVQLGAWLQHRLALIICLGLIGATASLYWPVRNHEFINFDDDIYVTENPHVQAGLTPRGVAQAFSTTRDANWIPLTWLSHMLDCQIYGLNPGGHHVTNLLFHLANTLLLFLILKRMTGKPWPSGFVAALFALHPLHVESVAWVAERKDVLSTFFWMLTMWAYVRYTEKPNLNCYLWMLLSFAAGLMSKPMLVTLPFVLLLLDYWPLGRFQPGQWRIQALPLIREKIPLFLLSAASSAVTFLAQRSAGAMVPLGILPFEARIANSFVSYVSYLGKMVWPKGLALPYSYPEALPFWQVAGSALVLMGITLGVIRLGRKITYLPAGWFWYLGTLVPVIGLVQVGGQAMADRYTYVPLIGLFIMIAMGLGDAVSGAGRRRIVVATSAGVALIVLLGIARIQVSHWQNSITIFEHSLAVTIRNPLVHYNLGIALFREGKAAEAIGHFMTALRIKPDYAEAHNNLGCVLDRQGRTLEAMAHYIEALRIKPGYEEPHNNLGVALSRQGKYEEAIPHYRDALRIKPDFAEAHNNLGASLSRQGKREEAMTHYIEALKIKPDMEILRNNPDYAEAHNNLGIALARHGKIQQAKVHFEKAKEIDPHYEKAYHNLGVALAEEGKSREAIAFFTEALRINPAFVEARFSLGMAYAAIGDQGSVLKQYDVLRTINPDLAKHFLAKISR